jgi:cysteine-rich repeat protein
MSAEMSRGGWLALGLAIALRHAATAAPLEVAHTYRSYIPPFPPVFAPEGGWAFQTNSRQIYVRGHRPARFGVDEDYGSVVALLERDPQTGTLQYVGAALDPAGPPVQFGHGGALVFGPGKRELYTSGDNGVTVLRLDPVTGVPAIVQENVPAIAQETPGTPDSLHVAVDGRDVYAGVYGSVAIYPRAPDGTLGAAKVLSFEGMDYREAATTADGRFLYALVRGRDESVILVFARDALGDTLDLVQRAGDGLGQHVSVGDLSSLAMSPDERHLYVADGDDPEAAVTVLSRDRDSGRLDVVQIVPREAAGPRCSRWIAISPEGTLLYVGCPMMIAVYHRDTASGRLALVQVVGDGEGGSVSGDEGIVPSPDGRHVYLLGILDDAVTVLRRTCGDGMTDAGEACDDSNTADGDGCDAACRVEPCFACSGMPSLCAPLDGAACDDHRPCTVGDVCAAGVCGGSTLADGASCDDGDACTTGDTCRGGTCHSGASVTCGTCEACDKLHGCVGELVSSCRRSPDLSRNGKGRLRLERPFGGGRFAEWQWVANEPTTVHEFGDPTSTTGYRLCVFDARGLPTGVRRRRHVVLSATVPPGGMCGRRPCWRRRVDGGVRYRAGGQPEGIRSIDLAPVPGGLPAIRVMGGGRRLRLGELPISSPATVQLRADDGACWEADYERFVRTNDAQRFVARGGLERYVPCGRSCGGDF